MSSGSRQASAHAVMGQPAGAGGRAQRDRDTTGKSGKRLPCSSADQDGRDKALYLAVPTFSSSGNCCSPCNFPESGTAVRNRNSCLAL